jgi:putative endonuclease
VTSGQSERRRRNRVGHSAELIAAAYMTALGYRVLARRYKTPSGEIDLILRKRGRIVFAEVKRRATIADCEASITASLSRRVRDAADLYLARRPDYQAFDIGFDVIFVTPWRLPRHLPNAL